MWTEAAPSRAGGCGTGVVPSGVVVGTPTAASWVGALPGVMAILLTVGAMGGGAKAKATLQVEGGGQSSQLGELGELLWLGASDGEDDSRRGFIGAPVGGGEPSGLLCKRKPSVVGGELPTYGLEGVSSGDAVHNNMYRGRVQVDGEGAWVEVEKLELLAAKRGCLNRLHGNEGEVVGGRAHNALD